MLDDPLRQAAFGDAPEADALGLLAACRQTPCRRWLAAVTLGGQGRYAAAASLCEQLRRDADPVFASLAASTLAAHRRQLGAHATARNLDAEALHAIAAVQRPAEPEPDGMDATGARADALLGLAADAVGLGRPEEAGRLLARLDELGPLGWRSRVRSGWVYAEASLASEAPDQALPIAEKTLAVAASSQALRHVSKSELVLAVVLLTSTTQRVRERADGLLTQVHERSLERDLLPLAWPSALLLADSHPERRYYWRDQARRAVTSVLSRTDAQGVRLAKRSLWFPTPLLQNGERAATEEAENFLTD